MAKEYRMYVNGEWVPASRGETFDDMNPYTGEVFGKIPAGGKQDAEQAVDAAAAAFPAWAETPPGERRRLFLKAADILEAKRDELMKVAIEETGATFGWAYFQLVMMTPGILREAAAQTYALTGETIPADLPGAFFMTLRQPVGVVGSISPWNAPYILSMRAVAGPMAYGNTIVLKPSEESPVAGGIALAEVFHEAGFPKGVFNVVTHGPGAAAAIGDVLVNDRRVRRMSFTGSTPTGRALAEKCGRNLKRIVLELGGKDPLIILKDADIDAAVEAAAFGSYLHQGQICMSTERILVEKPIAEEFAQKLAKKTEGLKAGDPREHDTVVGPLINQRQFDKVKAQVEQALGSKARLLAGGKSKGLVYFPTVLANVTEDMKVFSDETFGPIAPIMVVEDADHALEVANKSEFGLSGGIFTRDLIKGLEMAKRLESGMVHLNDQTVHDEPQVPFGGMKESGLGRHGGKAALEEFTETRWITIQTKPRHYPF